MQAFSISASARISRACGAALLAALTVAAAPCLAGGPTPTEREGPPNVILVLADDLGVEAVSTYGGAFETPNLSRMARDGVRLRNGIATPICTPTRVRLLTGKYGFRNYEEFGYLGPAERTLAHALGDAGYKTAVAGKWQFGGIDELEGRGASPADAGFDEGLVWHLHRTDRGSRYRAPRLARVNAGSAADVRDYPDEYFGPEVMNDYLLDFIEHHRAEPFFIYYAMVLPHDPFVTTPDEPDVEGDHERFGAMVRYMDTLLGRVLDRLDETGLADDTLVFFIGDNGTDQDVSIRYRDRIVRGGKGVPNIDGLHVPMVVQMPGTLPAGAVRDGLAEVLDVFPTVLDFIERDARQEDIDGVSLRPLLGGGATGVRDWVYMDYDPRWASYSVPGRFAMDTRYKLYDDGRLFDYRTDPMEEAPLARDVLPPPAARSAARLQEVLDDMARRAEAEEQR